MGSSPEGNYLRQKYLYPQVCSQRRSRAKGGSAMSLAEFAGNEEQVQTPEPGIWTLDTAHTTVGFVARYLMLTKVRGRFDRFSGAIHVAPEPEDSWVEVTIDADSINTNNPDRDNHL